MYSVASSIALRGSIDRRYPIRPPNVTSRISALRTIEVGLRREFQQSPYLDPGRPETGFYRPNSDSKQCRDGFARLSEKLRTPENLGSNGNEPLLVNRAGSCLMASPFIDKAIVLGAIPAGLEQRPPQRPAGPV